MADINDLDRPDGADTARDDATEFVRFWVVDGQDHVALRIGAFPPETEAMSWGAIAADIVKHALRAMVMEDQSRDETALIEEVEAAFHQRLAEAVDTTGRLQHGKAH